MIDFNKALNLIKSNVKQISGNELLLVSESIGRISSKTCKSNIDIPEFDCSSMDGIVINQFDLNKKHEFKIVGESKAGMKRSKHFSSGECIFIYTGAPLPTGRKKVIPIEYCKIINNKNIVQVKNTIPTTNFIRKKGSDVKKKKVLIKKNEIMSLRDISLLFSTKQKKINVLRKPKIAVVLTGDEVIESRKMIASNNTLTIVNLVKFFGGNIVDVRYVEDDKQKLSNVFENLNKFDLLVTSGGISKGKYDFVKEVLKEKKVKILFDQVSIKPGKPTTFGKIASNRFFLGLPGNPVSCFIISIFFLREIINSYTDCERDLFNFEEVTSLNNFKNETKLTLFLRVKKIQKKEKISFQIYKTQDSHMNFVLKDASGLLILKPKESIHKNKKYNIISFKNIFYNYI